MPDDESPKTPPAHPDDSENDPQSATGKAGEPEEVDWGIDYLDTHESRPMLATGPESRIKHRQQLRDKEKYIIDKILPAGTLNLIGGASGAGKTTWLLQLLYDWSHGLPVLGAYESYPCKWIYVSCDRATLETDRTIRRLALDEWEGWDPPIYSVEELMKGEPDIQKIYMRFPDVDLFIVEGLQGFIPQAPGQSQNRSEMLWVLNLRRTILSHGKTIVGTTHTPKQKWGDNFSNSRANILGSSSLIASCSTIITVDLPRTARESKKPVETDEREVTIHCRDGRDLLIPYTRDAHGRFIPPKQEEQELSLTLYLLTSKEELIPTTTMLEWGSRSGISRATTFRWIKQMLTEKRLEKAGHGIYKNLTKL